MTIYHLVTEPELLAGIDATHYTPARFAEDGFVHCCEEPASALAVARDYFAGARAPVFLLEIDARRLDARLVFEAPAPLPGAPARHLATAEKFPHVYGPIPLRAIAGCARLEPRASEFGWPERFAPLAESLGSELAARLSAGEARGLAVLRKLRRSHSRALRRANPKLVLELGGALVASGAPGARVLGSELVLHHPSALSEIRARDVRRLAGELASWSDVDVFACMIAGQAFRDGRISEAEILRWTRSRNRWWRRAALVSTVPLNVKAQGGRGDARRTLRICRALLHDPDDMVVKALSWALRALAERDPGAVRRFLEAHQNQLALRALREVRNKLRTGRKSG
ncbi:MAG TPA: DUF952 domain-containing protein [Myxococcota bacterium]|nr:DUF952 domain-containing protein [Myxococcota bacterium]